VSRVIMIMAGGTGGHVFPGLAVADCMRAQGWQVVWLGTESGMERRLVPARGYPMETIRFSGVRGKGVIAWWLLPLQLLIAFWQSAGAIFRVRPDVVLGMGGYPAFPGGMMAGLFLKPLAIHEQNSVAGLANRVLAQIADRVLVAYPDALRGRNVVLTGNPVREAIAALAPPEQRFAGREGRLRLLVVGGSLGAQALNAALPAALALIPPDRRPRVKHQSGEKHIEALRRAYAEAGVEGELLDFIDDMSAAYAECDLAICRAGALTVSELTAAGVASILVPFPHAVDDHQTVNARYLAERGAAVLMSQQELDAERLAGLLQSLDRARLLAMAAAARALGRPRAAQAVARACVELAA
jgi:UDP-N-acetylglucosamine--N-acetylmuramyl-(pentapeptide) pyrophosphoryl-undecaprenol N-acetylglucosamine transferase